VVKNRANGAKNPKAHVRQPVGLAEVLAAPLVAPPLRREDLCPVSDGAAAVIFAREDLARKRSGKPVWVAGVGLCADGPLGQRNLWESRALREAGARAYRMAGIADPDREIDAAEVSEQFSYQEPLWLKELGLNHPERVNRSGGCLCAHAVIAAGLVRIIEAAAQVRAGAARRTLAHGQYGLCGQSHCVWILGD
ncbi:MAG: thiolase family protein, partial [Elusimicrobia bacterium]|nr:thiolase family protein [Elusimicrobiota bacterium]